MRRIAATAVALLTLTTSTALTACGGDEPAVFGASGAWSRPTPSGATNGVLYLTITSDTDDALVAVDVPEQVAAAVELHETMVEHGGAGGHHGGGGGGEVMSMGQVTSFEIAAGGSVTFSPGGNHVMLIDLAEPLQTGESYVATLRFESGRTLDVDVVVADNPPG
jgi:copper(I)-binding protein